MFKQLLKKKKRETKEFLVRENYEWKIKGNYCELHGMDRDNSYI